MTNGGGTIVLGSHSDIYAPGGQGVLSNYNGRDVLYYHYSESSNISTLMRILTKCDPVDTTHGYGDFTFLGYNYIEYSSSGWPTLVY
jgi:arabinan endo-1,5-alpha-L-arabinosidase